MRTKVPGVYVIRNTKTGDLYIGGSLSSVRRRLGNHRRQLDRGTHHNPHLKSAWRKYGKKVFEFRPLIFCESDQVRVIEQHLLDTWSPKYNCSKSAYHPRAGVKASRKTRRLMSLAMKGRPLSPAHIQALRDVKRPPPWNKGKKTGPVSEERAQVLRTLRLGAKNTPEHNAKVSLATTGKRKRRRA